MIKNLILLPLIASSVVAAAQIKQPGNLNSSGKVNVAPASLKQIEGTSNCSFCNVKTFGYTGTGVGNTNSTNGPFSDHSWTVPIGITKIKIEAWSAGGNGWSEIYPTQVTRNDSIFDIRGGGGGGGAYYYGILSVSPGDIVKMRVPGGGGISPLIVQFSVAGKGYLRMQSGADAKDANNPHRFNGKGGSVETKTGVFSDNSYFFRGSDGNESFLDNYVNNTDNVTRTSFGGAPRVDLFDVYDINGGDGGQASKSLSGGTGYKFISYRRKHIPSKDGAFPGGGGGGSIYQYSRVGRGAAGLIIIYY